MTELNQLLLYYVFEGEREDAWFVNLTRTGGGGIRAWETSPSLPFTGVRKRWDWKKHLIKDCRYDIRLLQTHLPVRSS